MKKTATDIYKDFTDKLIDNMKDMPPEFIKTVDDHWEELVGPSGRLHETDYLFESGSFKLHSGEVSQFKIECDVLQPHSLETLCAIVAEKYIFGEVIGVPTGGIRIEKMLKKYCVPTNEYVLIVDDVLTTGESMEEIRTKILEETPNVLINGVVLFARGECPDWVDAVFQMWNNNKKGE